MPLSTHVPNTDDAARPSARRGRVWRTPVAPNAPAARRGRVWRTPVAPTVRRGRVWRSPALPEVVGRHLDDLDVVSPWPAARRGRVWRTPETGRSFMASVVALVVAAMILAGAGVVSQLDDFDALGGAACRRGARSRRRHRRSGVGAHDRRAGRCDSAVGPGPLRGGGERRRHRHRRGTGRRSGWRGRRCGRRERRVRRSGTAFRRRQRSRHAPGGHHRRP